MKLYTVTFNYMVEAESMDDAVAETAKDLLAALQNDDPVPFTVQNDNGERALITYPRIST